MILIIILWSLVFIISLVLLVKGADWFVENSEKIGLALKVSPFIIGITIVGLGTSLPELASCLAAVFKGSTEIVVANVVGSNIANIFLIVGLSALATKSFLAVRRSLIDIDLPLLASVTALFGFILWDGIIYRSEGFLLLFAFMIYLSYTFFQRGDKSEELSLEEVARGEIFEVLPSRVERRRVRVKKVAQEKVNFKVFLFLIVGVVFLIVGANYLIDSVLKLAEILKIGASIITILGVAVGTSLPELVVSVRAALQKKYEISLGNIFGSNVFNALTVVGLPAIITPLLVDDVTFTVGFPFMVLATFLLVVSGISRRISFWEGSMFLIIYILFVIKLFGLF